MTPPDDHEDQPSTGKLRVGQRVTINGVRGIVSRPGRMVDEKKVRGNPAFDPNYVSEQGNYNGPLWHPLDEDALSQEGKWRKGAPDSQNQGR